MRIKIVLLSLVFILTSCQRSNIAEQYVKSFQYEYEKLGFKEFLNSKNLPCDNVLESVLFGR